MDETLEQIQMRHIRALMERQRVMTRLQLGDDFVTVSLGELNGAIAEAEEEWLQQEVNRA